MLSGISSSLHPSLCLPQYSSSLHIHLKPRTAALSETKQVQHSKFRKRILKESKERKSVICPLPGQGEDLLPLRFEAMARWRRQAQHPSLGRQKGPTPGTQLEASTASGPQATRLWVLDTSFPLPRNVFLSAAVDWRKVSDRRVPGFPKAVHGPFFLLG